MKFCESRMDHLYLHKVLYILTTKQGFTAAVLQFQVNAVIGND